MPSHSTMVDGSWMKGCPTWENAVVSERLSRVRVDVILFMIVLFIIGKFRSSGVQTIVMFLKSARSAAEVLSELL